MMRTGHWIKPTIDAGMGAHFKVTCYEPEGAECRQVVDDSVDPSLLSSPGGWDAFAQPVVYKDGGFCQVEDFYASVGGEDEFYEGTDGHPVVEGPISIHYEQPRGDDDGGAYYWRYLDDEEE